MLDSSKVMLLVASLPFTSGAQVHRAALQALQREHWGVADRLFEAAATRYRRELACEQLARLRVHQSIARVRAGRDAAETAQLEIENALTRLDQIEALEPPFALVPAHALLGRWDPRATPAHGVEASEEALAA